MLSRHSVFKRTDRPMLRLKAAKALMMIKFPMVGVLASINVAVFILVIVCLIIPNDHFIERLSSLPTAWGAFLGSLVGGCGVAWATNKGFYNLIAAQTHRASIEEKGREHQRALNISISKQDRRDRAETIASAIMAEFNALLTDIHTLNNSIDFQISLLSASGRNASESMLQLQHATWHLPIWDKLVSDIGILGPSLASDVFSIYARTRHKPTGERPGFPNVEMAIEVYKQMKEQNQAWTVDLVHVYSRLGALIEDATDPGTLF